MPKVRFSYFPETGLGKYPMLVRKVGYGATFVYTIYRPKGVEMFN